MQLTEKAKQLIPKSRIVSFASWKDQYSSAMIDIFQQADDHSRYLTDQDLEKIQSLTPELSEFVPTAKFLRDHVSDIIAQARGKVLTQFPLITQPQGPLYPSERAEACWRDFWHFLRCISYGIAAQRVDYTSQEGLDNMELLYQELRVPLDAMVVGLEGLKTSSLEHLTIPVSEKLAPYFDHLISKMKNFHSV